MYMAGRQPYTDREAFDFSDLFWDRIIAIGRDGETLTDCITWETEPGDEVDLARDLVIANPWNRQRLAACLANIAVPGNPWRYDPQNHRIEMWEPMGVCFVHGGNHSIAVGIIKGVGLLPAHTLVDMRPLYNLVRCEGDRYVRVRDGTEVAPVGHAAFGAIYEIGRLLSQYAS